MGRLVGIDWGAKRIGVAVSTPDQGFVFPYMQLTINNEQLTVDRLLEIISDEKAVGVVVGLPLHADGTDSATTAMVRKFANDLAGRTDIPIVFIEENLTSHAAAERTKDNIDSESAAIILENAIAMIKRAQNG